MQIIIPSHPNQSGPTRWRSTLRVLLGAATLSMVCPPLHAKDVDVALTYTSAPTIYVEANGARYTQLSVAKHGGAPIQFRARLQISGGQDRIRSWSAAPRLSALGKSWGWSFDSGRPPEPDWGVVSRSYGLGDRPTNVDRLITMNAGQRYIETFAIDVCNAHADALRNQGQGSPSIFSSAYTLDITTRSKYKLSYTNIADTDSWQVIESAADPQAHAKIVCMKWAAARVPTSTSKLQSGIGVTQSSLSITETATVNGACKVHLSGVIETNVSNAQVRFRYEHTNGKKSDIKTVTTDHSKTASFSYQYDVPHNPDGGEAGSVRIVGVSPKFESAWRTYDMQCSKPAPQGLQAAANPTVHLTIEPSTTVMVDGQICPSAVLLHATLTASSAFHGKGLFLGDHFLTALKEIEVPAHQVKHVFEQRELNWVPSGGRPNTLAAEPPAGNPPMKTQKIRIGFNLTNQQGKVVAQAAQTWYTVSCKKPGLNPEIPGANHPLKSAPKRNSGHKSPLGVVTLPVTEAYLPRPAFSLASPVNQKAPAKTAESTTQTLSSNDQVVRLLPPRRSSRAQ